MKKLQTIAETIDIPANRGAVLHFTFLTLLTVAVYFLLTVPAHAGIFLDGVSALLKLANPGIGAMEEVLCTILLIILGDAGRGIATLAVMGMGIGAMMGKVSWGQALTVASGIAIMFGAPLLLPLLLFDPLDPSFQFPCVSWGL